MKKYIIITGGAGFVGSNLIKLLLKNSKFNIVSLDNYSTGKKNNHIKSNRINYIKGDTSKIKILLKKYKNKTSALFHFGEFSRIFQSFENFDKCYKFNTIGSKEVFKYCLDNDIKLIYSATSASLGKKGNDKNLSPYAFTKSKNLELLENLKKWFNLKFEIIYFYNVYGLNQICDGPMATVIGIFESQFKKNLPLTVVKPGTQSRRFTHISDTINTCYKAWRADKCRHYSISHKKSYSIIQVAKMFKSQIKMIPQRKGERYVSALTNMSHNSKVIKHYGKINLKDYITSFITSEKKKI